MSLSYALKAQTTGSTVSSVVSASFSVSAGDWLVVAAGYRDANAETLATPAVSGATVGSWTEVDSGALLDSGSSRYVRVRLSAAKVITGGSSVTVTSSAGGSVYTLMQNVGAISGGARGVAQTKGATGAAKPAVLSLNAAPGASSAVVMALVQIGFDVTTESVASGSGWTDDAAIGSTAVGLIVSRDMDAPQQSISWDGTGITSGKAQAMAGLELLPPAGAMMMAA